MNTGSFSSDRVDTTLRLESTSYARPRSCEARALCWSSGNGLMLPAKGRRAEVAAIALITVTTKRGHQSDCLH